MMKKFALGLVVSLGLSVAAAAEEPMKILFVDTGNTGRSVTAEALANDKIAKEHLAIRVISRAVDMDPFDVHPEANVVTLLKQRGLDVTSHVAAQIGPQDVKKAAIILTMTAKHKARVLEQFPAAEGHIFTLAEYATGADTEVADAYGKPMDVYVAMVKQVDGYVGQALTKSVKK